MTQTADKITPSISREPSKASNIPPLENGDHLTLAEFERRYDAMENLKRAELIEGVVHVAPPTSIAGHSSPHIILATVLGVYWAATPGTLSGDNGSIRLDLENMPQPDLFLMIQSAHGGQAKIGEDDILAGAPELVAEISATSASYDLHEKLRVYRRSGVREYIVWRTRDRQIDYFVNRQGEYQPLTAAADGTLRSGVFPGLWIDAAALIAGDLAKALSQLQLGLASPEHAAFVEAIKAKVNR